MPAIPIPLYESNPGLIPGNVPNLDVNQAPRVYDTSRGLREAADVAIDVVAHENERRLQNAKLDADVQASKLQNELEHGTPEAPGALYQLGTNAAGVTSRTMAQWDKEIVKRTPKLHDQNAQAQLARALAIRREDMQSRLTQHEFQQGQVADKSSTFSALDAYANEASLASGGIAREAALTRGLSAYASWGERNGIPKGTIAQDMAKWESSTLTNIAANMASTDPLAAQAFVDAEPRISFDDRANITKQLTPYRNDAIDQDSAQNLHDHGSLTPTKPEAVQAEYKALAGTYGATITSLTRTPEHNAEVGGVANSQHLDGTAGDFVVPDDKAEAFIADAKSRGYKVVDERKKGGTGPHIHLELSPDQVANISTGPATKSEALKAANQIEDRRHRLGVTAKLHAMYAADQDQRIESDRSAMDRINSAVFNATGQTTDLRKVLGNDFGYAVERGIADNLQNQLNHGNATSGDLAQQGLLDHQFYLAAAGNPDEQATAREFLRTLNPYDPNQWNLTQAQRRKYGNQIIAFNKNDAVAIADLTTNGKIIDNAMYNTFGDMTHAENTDAGDRYNQFRATLQNYIQAWKDVPAHKGQMPTQGDVQAMADTLLLQTVSGKYVFQAGPGRAENPDSREQVPVEAVAVPPEHEAEIRRRLGANATPQAVQNVYLQYVLKHGR